MFCFVKKMKENEQKTESRLFLFLVLSHHENYFYYTRLKRFFLSLFMCRRCSRRWCLVFYVNDDDVYERTH